MIAYEYNKLLNLLNAEQLTQVIDEGASLLARNRTYTDSGMKELQILLNTPTVGASVQCSEYCWHSEYLPNTQLMLLFPPIPIKAKYFVLAYGGIELYLAFTQPGSNIAHAAHLGGMLFGYILIRYWRKTTKTLY